eukprot:jgi/Ulvmu1/1644/UM114_0012.1
MPPCMRGGIGAACGTGRVDRGRGFISPERVDVVWVFRAGFSGRAECGEGRGEKSGAATFVGRQQQSNPAVTSVQDLPGRACAAGSTLVRVLWVPVLQQRPVAGVGVACGKRSGGS